MSWPHAVVLMLLGNSPGQVDLTPAEIADRIRQDEQTLQANNLKTAGPALVQFFRERVLSKEQIDRLGAKVALLGSGTFRERKQAMEDLIKAGALAKPLLQEALSRKDLEIVRRVELVLQRLTQGHEAQLACAAARLLAHRKPEGAAAAILAYLPFATDSQVIEELQDALTAVAVAERKPQAVVVEALKDDRIIKRGAAAEALIRNKVEAQWPTLRQLLADPALQVRLQVAQALVLAHDKTAVPVLIDLIPEIPKNKVWEVEDILGRIAGDQGPDLRWDNNTALAKIRDVWKAWYAKNESSLDLAKLSLVPQLQGYVLITQMDVRGGLNGRVCELKPNKEINWQITGLRYPVDAQVVGRDRVLICEYLNRMVTERDFQGQIKWQRQVELPVSAQRLPNGHTFIVARRMLLEVDRDGKEVFSFLPNVPSIAAGQRGRDGQIVLITTGGELQRLDPKGNLQKSFHAGQVYSMGANIELLPGGKVLVPHYRDNKVVEYDADGKVVWSANITSPTSATRLPNGHTLIVCLMHQRIVEIDRNGNEKWEYKTDGRPWRARKR